MSRFSQRVRLLHKDTERRSGCHRRVPLTRQNNAEKGQLLTKHLLLYLMLQAAPRAGSPQAEGISYSARRRARKHKQLPQLKGSLLISSRSGLGGAISPAAAPALPTGAGRGEWWLQGGRGTAPC